MLNEAPDKINIPLFCILIAKQLSFCSNPVRHTTDSRSSVYLSCVCFTSVSQLRSSAFVFVHVHTCTQTIYHLPETPELLSLWSKVKEMQQVNWSLRGQLCLISLFLHLRWGSFRQKKADVLFCLWQRWYPHFLELSLTGFISLQLHLTSFTLTPVTSCFPTGSSPLGSPLHTLSHRKHLSLLLVPLKLTLCLCECLPIYLRALWVC